MRFTAAVSFLLFSTLAGVAVAAPPPTTSRLHLVRQNINASDPSLTVNSTISNGRELSDANASDTSSADSTSSTGAVGGLLSGLTGTVGNIVDGVAGAVGSVADGVTGSNTVGDLLSGVTDTVGGVVDGVAGAAGSVVDGVTGLKRNARRAMFRRRIEARRFDVEGFA